MAVAAPTTILVGSIRNNVGLVVPPIAPTIVRCIHERIGTRRPCCNVLATKRHMCALPNHEKIDNRSDSIHCEANGDRRAEQSWHSPSNIVRLQHWHWPSYKREKWHPGPYLDSFESRHRKHIATWWRDRLLVLSRRECNSRVDALPTLAADSARPSWRIDPNAVTIHQYYLVETARIANVFW